MKLALWLMVSGIMYQLAGFAAEEIIREEFRNVVVGGVDIIRLEFIPDAVDIGDERIVDVQRVQNSNDIRIIPLKQGITSILVRDKAKKIRKNIKYNFSKTDKSQTVIGLREILHDVEGVIVKMIGDKIIMDGELIVPRDYDRVLAAQEIYKEAINLVSLSKVSQVVMAKRIQDEIQRLPGLINVTVRLANETFFLEGAVDSDADKQRAELIARTYLPEVMTFQAAEGRTPVLKTVKRLALQNLITVNAGPPPPPKKMVRITFHFVEMGKEFLKSSLFKWTPLLTEGSGLVFGESTTGGLAATTNGSFVGTITNLFPRLQAGSNGGFARILFSTVAIGMDGKRISFERKDQIPFVSTSPEGTPVPDNAEVGISIDVDPTIQGTDKVYMATSFSFSALSGAAGAARPRTSNTRLKNDVVVRAGESAVLGGLISNDIAKDLNKDPETPAEGGGSPLFKLLRSKSFRNKKTQFLVFITPRIIEDASTGTQDIKAKIIGAKERKNTTFK